MTCGSRSMVEPVRMLAITTVLLTLTVLATPAAAAGPRCFNLELYYRSSVAESAAVIEAVEKFVAAREGVRLRKFDLSSDDADAVRTRLDRLLHYYKVDRTTLPLVYGCRQILAGFDDPTSVASRLKRLLRMDVYTRPGCPRCAEARAWLTSSAEDYPGLEIRFFDIVANSRARDDLQQLARQYEAAAVSVPVFHFCDRLMVGFDASGLMRRRIEKELSLWTSPCPKKANGWRVPRGSAAVLPRSRHVSQSLGRTACISPVSTLIPLLTSVAGDTEPAPSDGDEAPPSLPLPPESPPGEGADDDLLPLPEDLLPLPDDAEPLLPQGEKGGAPGLDAAGEPGPGVQVIEVPVLGRLNLEAMGLPLFTIAIGLVDGFNPCAMWVLLFLLSILVNLKQRWKILAVAGTFVCISGLAYFAFMAAWLNVFLFVGLLRWVQVLLGILAVLIGSIHVKDYFAFKKGITLSIPDAARPGIYARVRRIVTAENLLGALIGASVLAVLVNIVELLCTAGLPALYTQILAMQNLPTWNNYLYLGLYNLAYMADDALMVTLVVVTLGRHKLQESQGRWLKLLSGSVILILGLIMLVRPDWLV